uniref:Uncharacterized protein n=1 Tax=Arundo donax TaxID=35708 RepID=A0A0A9AG15_ARUDO
MDLFFSNMSFAQVSNKLKDIFKEILDIWRYPELSFE